MRLRLWLAAFVLLAVPSFSHAAPITYNLTLTPSSGTLYGGTGFFTIANSPVASGVSTYTLTSGLTNLSFSVGGQTFDLSNYTSGTNTLVQFVNGMLNDITFSAATGISPNRFAIATTAGYSFYYNNDLSVANGTFSASPAAATAPEPSSLMLLGTGVLGVAGALRRRFA